MRSSGPSVGNDSTGQQKEGIVSALALDSSLSHQAVLELATAYDVASGMAAVAELVRDACAADVVEWWPADDGEPGPGQRVALGRAGTLLVVGGSVEPELEEALAPLVPILRRRRA